MPQSFYTVQTITSHATIISHCTNNNSNLRVVYKTLQSEIWELKMLGNFEHFIWYTLNQKLLVKLNRLLQKVKCSEKKKMLALESFS